MDQLIKLNIWILVCLLVGFTACADLDNEPVQKENSITIRLSNHKMSRSERVKDLNENLIKCADIFFFSTDAQGAPTENCLLHHKVADINEQNNYEFSISLNDLALGSYYIYAIANLEGIDANYNSTIDNLKSKTVPAITVTTGESGNNGVQPFFVMDGNITMTYTENMEGTIEIPLKRSAAKITLTVTVVDVEVGGTTYTPDKEQMTVELMHGEANGVVNGVTNIPSLLETGQYDINTSMTHDVPFYSYPTNIERTINNESKECYLELMIPWTSGNGTVRNYYYHIPIEKDNSNNGITALERNHHYMIKAEVSILGSLEEENPVELFPKYVVQDWSEVALDADLKNYRYLWVKEPINGQYWEMKNTEVLEIPYNSSHPCERIIVKCKQPNLYSGQDENHENDFTPTDPGTDPDTNHFYCGFVDGKIVYKHGLDNVYTNSTFDFTPYDIEITIQHIDDNNNVKDELSETIKIKQYPAIYAEKKENSDYKDSGDHHGYAFVNGYWGDNSHDEGMTLRGDFDNVSGVYNGSGVNSNSMLVFTVTSTHGTGNETRPDYIIGDPREKTPNTDFIGEKMTDGNSVWVTDKYRNTLTNYYATKTEHELLKNANAINAKEEEFYSDADALEKEPTYNMIAPKFRISSAYGAINGSDQRRYYHYMKKRCASYQEDGYPAGRWRLPTKAEFEFIIYLSSIGKIPLLYAESLHYWCAHGNGKPNNGKVNINHETDYGNGSGVSVRCVYDDWYWGSEPALTGNAKSTFTWGDEPINK